jgi:hypothetical protein
MGAEKRNPVAGGAADRADAWMLASKEDLIVSSESARLQQARYILKLYPLSLPVALVVAEHAFDAGGRP